MAPTRRRSSAGQVPPMKVRFPAIFIARDWERLVRFREARQGSGTIEIGAPRAGQFPAGVEHRQRRRYSLDRRRTIRWTCRAMRAAALRRLCKDPPASPNPPSLIAHAAGTKRKALHQAARQPPAAARSKAATSSLTMPCIARNTRPETAGSGSARNRGRTAGTICHGTPQSRSTSA